MRWKRIFVVIAGILVPVLVGIFAPFSGLLRIAHETTQLHLNLIGSSIYEYHAKTGKWPTQLEDLAKTSLPEISPHWRTMIHEDVYAIVWHKDLKADPKDNTDHVLVYHKKGLIATSGQSWVCWGDLRTEYVKTEDLRAHLQKQKE